MTILQRLEKLDEYLNQPAVFRRQNYPVVLHEVREEVRELLRFLREKKDA